MAKFSVRQVGSSAHAGVMAYLRVIQPQELAGVVIFGVVGLALLALSPARPIPQLPAGD